MDPSNIDRNTFDDEVKVDVEFRGRQEYIESLKANWESNKIVGVFGLRSVGKSRLCQEFIRQHIGQDNVVIRVDSRRVKDTSSFCRTICLKLGIDIGDTESDRWITDVIEVMTKTENKRFLVFFDNLDDLPENNLGMRSIFMTLCTHLVRHCSNVKILISSTTQEKFSQFQNIYFSMELLPFKDSESLELLTSVLHGSGIDLGEYTESVVRRSEGLPLLILMIASDLKEDCGVTTPKDMAEWLEDNRLRTLSSEFYLDEDRVANVYTQFIERLSPINKNRLAMLTYIPGSFSVEQAQTMLGFPTEGDVKKQVLIPLRRRHYLKFDRSSMRFDIQGILRECLQTFAVIRNIPEVRARYISMFTEVMKRMQLKIASHKYKTMVPEVLIEQSNLTKLLTEVQFATQDTYPFFMEIITTCTQWIEIFMRAHSGEFYIQCLRLAKAFDRQRDIAALYMALGSMYTNIKAEFCLGEENYKLAMTYFKTNGTTLELATVYQRMGWTLHKQGRNEEAIGYFNKSLEISMPAGEPLRLVCLQSMSSMGLAYTFLGKFEYAENYLFATLEKRRNYLGENHPFIGAGYNNIGIMYKEKGEWQKAVEYFQLGLKNKRDTEAPVVSILDSLNMVANAYTALGEFQSAHALLDEAVDTLKKEKLPMKEFESLTYTTRGKVFAKEGKLEDAKAAFTASINISEGIMPNSVQFMRRLLKLARVDGQLRNYAQCLNNLQRVLDLKTEAIRTVPCNFIILECLECMLEVYESNGERKEYSRMLDEIEQECLRLEKGCLNSNQLQKLSKVRAKVAGASRVSPELSELRV